MNTSLNHGGMFFFSYHPDKKTLTAGIAFFSFIKKPLWFSERDWRNENPPLESEISKIWKHHSTPPSRKYTTTWQRLFFHQISATRVKIGKKKSNLRPCIWMENVKIWIIKYHQKKILALVSGLENFSFSPCIWMEI